MTAVPQVVGALATSRSQLPSWIVFTSATSDPMSDPPCQAMPYEPAPLALLLTVAPLLGHVPVVSRARNA